MALEARQGMLTKAREFLEKHPIGGAIILYAAASVIMRVFGAVLYVYRCGVLLY